MTHSFLTIPLEIRYLIYNIYLGQHQKIIDRKQPSNEHILFLHTCRQISIEAGDQFRQYISFKYPKQWMSFVRVATQDQVSQICWADVANDARLVESEEDGDYMPPASQLYLALERILRGLKRLRVFNDYGPWDVNTFPENARYWLHFEKAMFPFQSPHLDAYELYIDIKTKAVPFQWFPADGVQSLRLSGHCWFSQPTPMPKLRHLTLHTITSPFFDRLSLDICFSQSKLESFFYARGHLQGMEIRNHHLESLVPGIGSHLRKLVLLECSKVTSDAISSCLRNLPLLQYFALSFLTVNELNDSFVRALPPLVSTLKLQVLPTRYSIPLYDKELDLCQELEALVFRRRSPLEVVCLNFREEVLAEDNRKERWNIMAKVAQIMLRVGPWEVEELTTE